MKTAIIFLCIPIGVLCTLLNACGSSENELPALQSEQDTKIALLGKWYLNEWTLYRELTFHGDSSLVIDNHIDTIYRYKYMIRKDTLILLGPSDRIFSTRFMLLSPESLVVERLPHKSQPLRYSRVDRQQRQ